MLLTKVLQVCILGSCTLLASATQLNASPICFNGCQLSLKGFHFNDTVGNPPTFTDACQSRLKSTSLFLCVHEYCEPNSQILPITEYNETCRDRAHQSLPPFGIIGNFTEEQIARFRRVETGDKGHGQLFDEVLVPSQTLFQLAYDTIDVAAWEGDLHYRYGLAMLWFWVVVIAIGMMNRLLCILQHLRHGQWMPLMSGDEDGDRLPKPKGTGVLHLPRMWIKKYLVIPATFGYRCSQNIKWCTVPARMQSLTILAFIVINVVLCTVNYRAFHGNLYWSRVSQQYWRYISDRTGIISYANFPLIWLFGVRNNVLLWLTGWGFGTYNSFHRWIARVATVEAIVHSVGYTIMVLETKHGWTTFCQYWTQRWWWAGEMATIVMVAICCFSVYGLRRSYYELFLQIHVWFSAAVLLTMLWHVEIFRGEYDAPAWVCIAVWILDRLMRIYRVLSFNPRFWKNRSTITYDPDSNIIRMAVPNSSPGKPPPPGTYYYIYVLDIRFWESHPFTVASISSSDDSSTARATHSLERLPSPVATDPILAPDDPQAEDSSLHGSDESELLLPSSKKSSSLTFLIRPYDGFTSRLRNAALLHPATPLVLIEGPYGDTHPFHEYDTVLFIVGGSGIATALSYLPRLISSNKVGRTSSIRIIWAVREHKFLSDIIKTDLETHLDNESLSLDAYVTQHPETIGRTTDDPATSLLTGPWKYKHLRVFSGRPNVHGEVHEAAKSALGHSGYRLAVVACGPAQMADDTRRAVTHVLHPGCENVDYFEESYKW